MKSERKQVANFEAYETIIKEFQQAVALKSQKYNIDYVCAYRGVQEFGGKRFLTPSLDWKNLIKYEYDLIHEMRRFKPLDFNNLFGLDLLGKCRHYNLPSRLLDFSLSHYVALFFAVTSFSIEQSTSKECKVYCLSANMRNETPAENISRIPMRLQPSMYNEDKKEVDSYIEKILNFKDENMSKDEEVKRFIKKTLLSPIFVYPRFYTIREQNQQSIFMVFPNKVKDLVGNLDFSKNNWEEQLNGETNLIQRFKFLPELFNPIEESENGEDDLFWEIVISPDAIDEIKKKLNMIGIDEAFLFSDNLEYTARKIEQQIVERIK